MVRLKITCNECNAEMSYLSSSGSSKDVLGKEIWGCPICKSEIRVAYQREKIL